MFGFERKNYYWVMLKMKESLWLLCIIDNQSPPIKQNNIDVDTICSILDRVYCSFPNTKELQSFSLYWGFRRGEQLIAEEIIEIFPYTGVFAQTDMSRIRKYLNGCELSFGVTKEILDQYLLH